MLVLETKLFSFFNFFLFGVENSIETRYDTFLELIWSSVSWIVTILTFCTLLTVNMFIFIGLSSCLCCRVQKVAVVAGGRGFHYFFVLSFMHKTGTTAQQQEKTCLFVWQEEFFFVQFSWQNIWTLYWHCFWWNHGVCVINSGIKPKTYIQMSIAKSIF